MSVTMEHSGVEAVPRSAAVPRVRVSNGMLIGFVVGLSAAVRIVAGALKSTPDFFLEPLSALLLAYRVFRLRHQALALAVW